VNDAIFISISEATPVLPGTQESWEGKGVQPDLVTAPGEEIAETLKIIKSRQE